MIEAGVFIYGEEISRTSNKLLKRKCFLWEVLKRNWTTIQMIDYLKSDLFSLGRIHYIDEYRTKLALWTQGGGGGDVSPFTTEKMVYLQKFPFILKRKYTKSVTFLEALMGVDGGTPKFIFKEWQRWGILEYIWRKPM